MIAHQFFGYCRGTATKAETAAFNRGLAGPIDVPVAANGAIITGKQPDGRFLVVIDLDVADGEPPLPLGILDEASRSTFVVRSGRGGLHVYFYTDAEIPGAKHVSPVNPLVHQVDRRGTGGIIFAPGCAFVEHGLRPYAIALDNPVRGITAAEFWAVWDAHGRTRYEERVPGKSDRKAATAQKSRAAGWKDVPRVPRFLGPDDADEYPMFPPCIAALMACCVKGEHLYHEERFFLACYMNSTGWNPEAAIEPLFANMPDYDARTTRKQVAHVVARGYKPAGCRKLKVWGMCPRACGRKNPANRAE